MIETFTTTTRQSLKQLAKYDKTKSYEFVKAKAIELNALMFVKTSRDTWYIKGEYTEDAFYKWYYKLTKLQEIEEGSSSIHI